MSSSATPKAAVRFMRFSLLDFIGVHSFAEEIGRVREKQAASAGGILILAYHRGRQYARNARLDVKKQGPPQRTLQQKDIQFWGTKK